MRYVFFFLFTARAEPVEIYTSLKGEDSDICAIFTPCSFASAINKTKKDDIVYIKGDYIGDPVDLEQARVLFNEVLAKGAMIMSDNMTINGTFYRPVGLSFIVVQSASNSRIHQFHFTGFRHSIACFRTVEKGVISLSTFSNNHVEGGIGMLAFGVGKCKLDECNLTENSIQNSSLIEMYSTHLYLNMTLIERNYVLHESRQALLFGINSVCEYTNTTIRRNSSPFSPLHQFEFRSCFGFWNCTFEENRNTEFMLCDGTCEFNFTNNTIQNNMGSILTTSPNAVISFNESEIINNFSGDLPLFDVPGAEFYIYHPCNFVGNRGSSIIDTRGLASTLSFRKAKFKLNSASDAIINVDSSSNVLIRESRLIDNSAPEGAIKAEDSNINLESTKFSRNSYSTFQFRNTTSIIENCRFKYNSGQLQSNRGFTNISKSIFIGQSYEGLIYILGKKSLTNLHFVADDPMTVLASDLINKCKKCKYGKYIRKKKGITPRQFLKISIFMFVFFGVLMMLGSSSDKPTDEFTYIQLDNNEYDV